jgi:hypothetical protein
MDIQKFVFLRPYLYHLTDKRNLVSIFRDNILRSTVNLVSSVGLHDADIFLHTRRVGHKDISNTNRIVILRDQDPLFEKIASKNLESGVTFGDFVHILNSRVFFWAKESDLAGHYKRYENQKEYPVILRLSTSELFDSNDHNPKFCRLNSGAPRCSSYYKEGAPPRGHNTFLYAEDYQGTPSSVREVTFENYCKLPSEIYISSHPTKKFSRV